MEALGPIFHIRRHHISRSFGNMSPAFRPRKASCQCMLPSFVRVWACLWVLSVFPGIEGVYRALKTEVQPWAPGEIVLDMKLSLDGEVMPKNFVVRCNEDMYARAGMYMSKELLGDTNRIARAEMLVALLNVADGWVQWQEQLWDGWENIRKREGIYGNTSFPSVYDRFRGENSIESNYSSPGCTYTVAGVRAYAEICDEGVFAAYKEVYEGVHKSVDWTIDPVHYCFAGQAYFFYTANYFHIWFDLPLTKVVKIQSGTNDISTSELVNEIDILKKLGALEFKWAPRLLHSGKMEYQPQGRAPFSAIYFVSTHMGKRLTPNNIPHDYLQQWASIQSDLSRIGLVHGDILKDKASLRGNQQIRSPHRLFNRFCEVEIVVNSHGRFGLVDFSLSSFGEPRGTGDKVALDRSSNLAQRPDHEMVPYLTSLWVARTSSLRVTPWDPPRANSRAAHIDRLVCPVLSRRV